jgi:hypothetical protein
MAPRPITRLAPPVVEADRAALRALQDLADYTPLNRAYSAEALRELEAAMAEAMQAEERSRIALEMARDKAIEATQAFHDAMLGAKAQVIAQYGSNSHAVQAIGLKRKSERRRPTRRAQAAS